jgi:hypothetical protein
MRGDCFDGCVEIISDKCIEYTGPDIVELGIKTGDSLAKVIELLVEHFTSEA